MASKTETKMRQADPALAERLQLEIERSVQRALRGIELMGAPPPTVGQTPKTVLHRRGMLELVHYHALTDEVYRIPLLIVMAPTNKGYVLDLTPGQSLVEFLLQRGYDVYMIDWNEPTVDEAYVGLEHYTMDFIPDCIRRVQEDSGEQDVNLVAYCAGGMLAVIYQALHADGPVRNLACFTTPIDYSHMELFRAMSDEKAFDLDAFVDQNPVIPASMISAGFEALRPAAKVAGQIRLWDRLWDDKFVKGFRMMERWGNETLPLPGAYFKQTVHELLRENRLYEGRLRIRGHLVDLSKITIPLLHVVAKYDHIVPAGCTKPLVQLVASEDKQEVVLSGGHISIAAGANAIHRMWPRLDAWLEGRSV